MDRLGRLQAQTTIDKRQCTERFMITWPIQCTLSTVPTCPLSDKIEQTFMRASYSFAECPFVTCSSRGPLVTYPKSLAGRVSDIQL